MRCMMEKGYVHIFCGEGKGKTTAAVGQAIRAASIGKNVFIIQFLKEKLSEEIRFIERLEPEIKLFRFQKADCAFGDLTQEEQVEEAQNIRNGWNFAKKVMVTQECDMLILDEVLGLIEKGIITEEEVKSLITSRDENMSLILTGIPRHESLWEYADMVTEMIQRR